MLNKVNYIDCQGIHLKAARSFTLAGTLRSWIVFDVSVDISALIFSIILSLNNKSTIRLLMYKTLVTTGSIAP